MQRATFYNPGTPQLFKVTDYARLIDSPGPKWTYTLKPINLEYVAATGDVKPYSPTPEDPVTVTGYNVLELDNTPATWFGLAATEYKGLEFEPCPIDAAILGSMVPMEMVTSAGAYATGQPDFVALFHWANQLSGECD